jgi:hypothetical protein
MWIILAIGAGFVAAPGRERSGADILAAAA